MRVDDRDTAEDITSITFMKAWEKLPAYKERGVPFRAWLFRIARNATIDHYRTRRPVESLDEIVGFSDPKEPSVSDTFESKLESQEVREMIRALTPLQKEVIVLKFLAGFSTSEVAEYLGKGEGAVRAIQMRALRALSSVPRESALMELASDNLA
jgi:RNA polymerase sigma-70 factor (ECF subfamily)